jgi:DNA polymerase-2
MSLGFLLTSHAFDTAQGLQVCLVGTSEEGPFELRFTNEKAIFFVHSDAEFDLSVSHERKPLPLADFGGKNIDALYFSKLADLYEARDQLATKGIRTFESDVRPAERFLMERFIKGSVEFVGELSSVEQGVRIYHNPKIKASTYIPKLSSISIDIETSRGDDLFSIALHYHDHHQDIRQVFMVGAAQGPIEDGELFYYPDEKSCYQAFEKSFLKLDPDLILGWHVVGFDLLFLDKKCRGWGSRLSLGRRGRDILLRENANNRGWNADVFGRCVLDGPPTLRGAFYSFENFKLDTVAAELLGRKKLINQTGMEKVAEIERQFREDKVSLARYNLEDCVLVTEIYQKTNLIELMTQRVFLTGLLFDRVAFSTSAFDYFMLPLIHRKGVVAPNILDMNRTEQTAGGLVLDPVAGMHEGVFVLDFKSLYPSIIRTFKIDPYSRLNSHIDTVTTPTGHQFSGTEHLLPELLTELMEKRKQAKEQNNAPLSQAIKILMNSLYGVMGTTRSRFYHADLPSSITGTGQWLLKKTVAFLEEQGHQVVYGDTDSVFVKTILPPEKGMELASLVNTYINEMVEKEFHITSFLEMEFEKYFVKIFLPKLRGQEAGAKKKYVGMLENHEIYFSGMEYVRSDWTRLAKNFQKKLYQKFMAGEDIEEFIKGTINDLSSGIFDEDLVYQKRMSKKLEEYTKSRPPHVQAAQRLQEAGQNIPSTIEYVITQNGPIPVELSPNQYDYEHYRERQIRPLAEVVLEHLGVKFDDLFGGGQLDLF